VGGLQAQAGQISLPTTLDNLLSGPPPVPPPTGPYAIVSVNGCVLEFSNFTYIATPLGSPPTAHDITVSQFPGPPAGEPGLTFNGVFTAAANTTVDYAFTYQVTALSGKIVDAFLSASGFTNGGGTGSFSIGETIFGPTGIVMSKVPFEVSSMGQGSDISPLLPSSTIFVHKDVSIIGGSLGATLSFINQGYSCAIPEPASMALLGIGLSGLLTFRRFFKRVSVA
jgi:hypothetical protein